MAIEIVDFPIKNGGSFHSNMLVHQRVRLIIFQPYLTQMSRSRKFMKSLSWTADLLWLQSEWFSVAGTCRFRFGLKSSGASDESWPRGRLPPLRCLGRWGMSFGVDLYQNLVIMLNFLPHSANKTEYDEVDMACWCKWSGKMAGFYGWVDWICRNMPIFWWRNHAFDKKKQTINY